VIGIGGQLFPALGHSTERFRVSRHLRRSSAVLVGGLDVPCTDPGTRGSLLNRAKDWRLPPNVSGGVPASFSPWPLGNINHQTFTLFSEAPIQRKAPLFLSRALPSLFRFQHPSTLFFSAQGGFLQPQKSSLGASFAIASPPKVRCSRSIWSLSQRASGSVASLNWSSKDRLPVPLQCVHWWPRLGVPGMR